MEYWDHNEVVKKIAAEHGLEPRVVNKILSRFFSRSGLQAFIVALRKVKLQTFISFLRTKRTMRIRQSFAYRENQKKRKYYYKKVRPARQAVKETII